MNELSMANVYIALLRSTNHQIICGIEYGSLRFGCYRKEQVAQLSQRNRAAGWVSFGQKWKMIPADNIAPSSTTIT